MKKILIFSSVFVVITLASLAIMYVTEVISLDEATKSGIRALAVILIAALAGAGIYALTGKKA